jgi:type IV fimbrial biogenesis protein FimT
MPARPPLAHRPARTTGSRVRGLTLVELVIALAVLAILATLAMPSMAEALQRQRLRAHAEQLAADVAEARFEATRRGQALHLQVRAGPDWCWAVAAAPDCGCGAPQPCQLTRAQAGGQGGVQLLESRSLALEPAGSVDHGTAPVQVALFEGQAGSRLRVELTALGRVRLCAPGVAMPGVAPC